MTSDPKELMDTAMTHNHKILSTILRESNRSLDQGSAEPQEAAGGAPTLDPRRAAIQKMFADRVKQLQQKFAPHLSPKRMQELHLNTISNLSPGSQLAPSSESILNRTLTGTQPLLNDGMLEASSPFMPHVGGMPLQ